MCYREHITLESELSPEQLVDGLPIICPKTEMSPAHRNYGKICGRLAFRNFKISQKEKLDKQD